MEISQHSKEVAKGSFWGLLGNLIFKLSSFFYTVLIARVASQNDVGLFYLGLSIISLFAVFSDLGLSGSVLRYLPFFEGRNQKSKIKDLIRSSYKIVLVLGLLLSSIIFLSADWIGQVYHNQNLPDTLRIFSAFILIQNIFRLDLSFLQSKGDIKFNQFASNIQNVSKLIFTSVLFYLYGPSVATLILAFILSHVLAILIMFLRIKDLLSQLPKDGAGISKEEFVNEIIPLGILIGIVGAFSLLLASVDRIVMGLIMDPTTVETSLAIYSIATALAISINIFPGAVQGIFFPVVSRIFGKGANNEAISLMQSSQRWSMFITIPIAVVMIIFSSDMLRIFYGVNYQPGWLVLSLFTLGSLFTNLLSVIGFALVANRLVKIELQMSVAATILNILLCVLLVPLFGINGAALAWFISMGAITMMLQYYGKKIFNFTTPSEIYKLLFAGLVAFILALLVKPLIVDLISFIPTLSETGPTQYIISKLIYLAYLGILSLFTGVLFILLSLFLKCFHSEDISLMNSVLRRAFVPQPIVDFAVKVASYGVK
ncbi:Polysaccharide biosynthesis protein [Candidatus Bilamarchaeum dharawalense]|uniref:Polysaccharide biosynthesis protein n=1 Tax=Candidatus Bilamarchaeum dharawalense TaxID=2885759 RepID=A0A5E4LTW6_9ARCH|nr:Polysaccharide biosynthesis protein [Candidatus Bilamarchaeum dharawalense]